MIRKEWMWSLLSALELSEKTVETKDEKRVMEILTKALDGNIEVEKIGQEEKDDR